MAEEKRSLVQRLRQWLFGRRKANRSEQKERRDEFATFLEEHAEEEEKAAVSRKMRT